MDSILGDLAGFAGTLLSGGLLGGVLRLIPFALGLWEKKKEADHEYRMAQLSKEVAQLQGQQKLAEIGAAGDQTVRAGEMAAFREAIRAQGQITNNWFIDLVNQTVRPALTYWWMTLYTMVKIALLVVLAQTTDKDIWQGILSVWTPADATVLASIIAFWFVDRAITKKA